MPVADRPGKYFAQTRLADMVAGRSRKYEAEIR